MIDVTSLNTQQARILTQLRKRPVRTIDFDHQPAVDGGTRILRTAARVGELRALGCVITSRKVKGSGGALVAEYTLVSEPAGLVCREGGNCHKDRRVSAVVLSSGREAAPPESRREAGRVRQDRAKRPAPLAGALVGQLNLFTTEAAHTSHYDLETAA